MDSKTGMKDSLTGAYTRGSFDHRYQIEVEKAKEKDYQLSLLIIDLDHFKSVNDAFGHARGDEVLIELVKRIGSMIRSSDLLFRYGGDEFALLLIETDKAQARVLAERILDRVRSTLFSGDPPLSLSLTIGVADLSETGSPEALFEKADQRLLIAKRLGRGQVMAEDGFEPSSLQFHDISRLVERESQLDMAQGFLDSLLDERRGVLKIIGPQGSGRTCFLREVAKGAQLRGYGVLEITTTPALKVRSYGALQEAMSRWMGESQCLYELQGWVTAISRQLREEKKVGLFIAVDDVQDLDSHSLSYLQEIFLSLEPSHLAIAFTSDRGRINIDERFEASLIQEVEIGPFSRTGLHVWLRELLQCEPDIDFLQWLYRETAGFPSRLQKSLLYLTQKEFLKESREGWIIKEGYTQLPLSRWLEEQKTSGAIHLPPLTNFIGRQLELNQLKSLLGSSRSVTLLGPGGIGKTRLAIQVAAEMADNFRDGVYLISLAPLESGAFLISTLADAVGFSFFGQEEPKTQLLQYLNQKEMLLIMDNFEHLQDAVEVVVEILREAPDVHVLITSREKLDIPENLDLELRGMDFPQDDHAKEVDHYPAVQLFTQRADHEQSRFVISEDEKHYAVRICKLVEGMPLGIELAASWVGMFSLKEIVEQIEQDLDFLVTSRPDIPERHRSLRAVFDRFWSFLSESEKMTLGKMCIFRGGFDGRGAERVAQASVFFLSALVDRSFLRKVSSTRYEMHEVLRQYAEEKLIALEEEYQQARCFHSEYYAEHMNAMLGSLTGGEQIQSLGRISEEVENVRRGWNWAVENHYLDAISFYLEPLFRFYDMRNRFYEAEDLLNHAISHLKPVISEIKEFNSKTEFLLGKILSRRGRIAFRLSRQEEAKEMLERSLHYLPEGKGSQERAFVYNCLGEVERTFGEYKQAMAYHRKALRIYECVDDRDGQASSYNLLAIATASVGELEEAKRLLTCSLDIWHENDNQWGTANVLNNLGNIEYFLGNPEEAKRLFHQNLLFWRKIKDRRGIANALNNLGRIAVDDGTWEEARKLCLESLDIFHEIGDQLGKALSLINLATSTSKLGDPLAARKYFVEAMRIGLAIGVVPMILEGLIGLAMLQADEGKYAQALEWLFFAKQHPAADQDLLDVVEEQLKDIELVCPPQDFSNAQEKDQTDLQLEDVVHELLEEMNNDIENKASLVGAI